MEASGVTGEAVVDLFNPVLIGVIAVALVFCVVGVAGTMYLVCKYRPWSSPRGTEKQGVQYERV